MIRESDHVLVRVGPLAGLRAYVEGVEGDEVDVRAEGFDAVRMPADGVEVLPPAKPKSYDQILRDIEAAVLDGDREPTDEELAVLEARLHGRIGVRARRILDASRRTVRDPRR